MDDRRTPSNEVLEERIHSLSAVVREIKDNHLSHIADDIKNLDRRMNGLEKKIAYWTGGMAAVSFIANLIVGLL